MSKIFVRHRRHVGRGAGRPRFAVVAAQGVNLKVYKTRVRRTELEKIAAEIDAEIIYLPRGESEGKDDDKGKGAAKGKGGKGKRRRKKGKRHRD